MSRLFTALAMTAVLAGCDGTNPFMVDEEENVIEAISDTGDVELIDANDPNTDVNSQFAYDPTQNLTMNSVVFDDNGTTDTTDDTLTINNLPFDGPDGVYDDIAGQRTENASGQVTNIFQNTEAVINGEQQYYAVYVESDYLDATSAAGREWAGFGFAGANLNRTEYETPSNFQGSYEYLGVYAATRTYDDRSGIELISGNATIYLDVADTDPLDGLQGTVVGVITDRTRNTTIGDAMVGDLPNVSLVSVSFNTETGLWEDGLVQTQYDGAVRDSGTHTGLVAGPDAEELGGYLIMSGVADIQTITFEIVEYEIDDGAGNITTGQITGQQVTDNDLIQALVNSGTAVGTLTVDATDLPDGAIATGTTFDTFDVSTEFDAREIGVFVADLN